MSDVLFGFEQRSFSPDVQGEGCGIGVGLLVLREHRSERSEAVKSRHCVRTVAPTQPQGMSLEF